MSPKGFQPLSSLCPGLTGTKQVYPARDYQNQLGAVSVAAKHTLIS